MADTSQPDQETEPVAPLAGLRLLEARRARDISALDIANELHLDEAKVRALEENQFDVLGAPVFAKGHLRSYAEIVGLSTDDIMADYYALNRAIGVPPVVAAQDKWERNYHIGRWIAAIVTVSLLAALAMAGYWWLQRSAANPQTQSRAAVTPLAQTVESSTVMAEESSLPAPPQELADASASQGLLDNTEFLALSTAAGVEPLSAEAELPLPDVPQATVAMTFSGDCWTEVLDASGARLYFDLAHAGRHISITGAAPLSVLLGDTANVHVVFNGLDYVIPDRMQGRIARLTVNAR